MVLNDSMKLGVTDDEEEIVAHVSFVPGIEEQKYKQEGTTSTQKSKNYHPILF